MSEGATRPEHPVRQVAGTQLGAYRLKERMSKAKLSEKEQTFLLTDESEGSDEADAKAA